MPRSFLDFLESMTIAMEADDITGETADDVRKTLGGTPSTQDAPTNDDEPEDLEKVDDIFGFEEPENKPTEDPAPQEAPEEPGQPEENPEDTPMDEEGGSPEEDPNVTGDAENPEEMSEDTSTNEDLVFTKKNRIRDNLSQLYTIISGNIEVIVNSLTGINDETTIHVMNIVLNHLRNCKEYIYKTLTVELSSLEYDELLQRYITLKRVYDICIEIMEKHFNVTTEK